MYTVTSATFAALAEPNRLSIIDMLSRRGRLSASVISKAFSCTPSAVSQHLKVLQQSGLIAVQRQGKQRIYSLNTAAMSQAQAWLEQRSAQWNLRLDAMENYLAEQQSIKGKTHEARSSDNPNY